jgi:hypothetical protein
VCASDLVLQKHLRTLDQQLTKLGLRKFSGIRDIAVSSHRGTLRVR